MDVFKEACNKYGINLIYTNNKIKVLSSQLVNNTPTIRASKSLKDIPNDIIDSIIDYYISPLDVNRNKFLNTITLYISRILRLENFSIAPPNPEFLNTFHKIEAPKASKDNLNEAEILKITKLDFWGREEVLDPKDTIDVSASEMIELNIIVKD